MRLLPLLALLELAHSYEEVSDEQDIVCAAAGFLVLADAVSKVRCRHYLRKAALPPIQVLSHARADADALSEAHEHARSTRARAHSCIGAGSRLWWCMTTLRARCSLLSVSLCVSISAHADTDDMPPFNADERVVICARSSGRYGLA